MKTPKVAGSFNTAPKPKLDDLKTLAEQAPEDAAALGNNLQKLYEQGQKAYGIPDQFNSDAREVMSDGRLAKEEVYNGRPAFQVYEVSEPKLGTAWKAQYVPGRLYQRDGTMFFKMDGGRELQLAASERMPHDNRGELRKDLIGGFVSQQGDSARIRLKGTLGADGRFKVEFAAPDRKGWETFEHGRLWFNPQANWLELQTPRGNVVITNEKLKDELIELTKISDRPSIGLLLPGEAKPGPRGGLVYDEYPAEYGALTGYSRKSPNVNDGPSADTRITYANFGFSALSGVPVVFPSDQQGRIERNTERRGDAMWGPDAVNGRFWAFGHFSRGPLGELGFKANEVTEQTDRWILTPGHPADADAADAVKTLAEAEDYGGGSGPVLSDRNDGW